MRVSVALGVAVAAVFVWSADAVSSCSYACGACMMLVHELEADIAKIDPKKTIEVGSYRVNPQGEQLGLQQIPFARSQAHITEVLEHVCDKSKEYHLVVNPKTGKGVYVNKASTYLRGEASSRVQSKLQSACNDFVDSYDDDIVNFFKNAHEEPVKAFCNLRLGQCTSVDVTPLPPNEPEDEKTEENEINDEL